MAVLALDKGFFIYKYIKGKLRLLRRTEKIGFWESLVSEWDSQRLLVGVRRDFGVLYDVISGKFEKF